MPCLGWPISIVNAYTESFVTHDGFRLPFPAKVPSDAIMIRISAAPVARLSAVDAPAIYSPPLEKKQLPDPQRVIGEFGGRCCWPGQANEAKSAEWCDRRRD
jgi:hypothetical protein